MSSVTSALPGKLPPGPRGLPVFGSLLDIRNDTHLSIDRLVKRYGDICLLRFGSVPTVIISNPELLHEAFGKAELADRWVSEIMDILSGQKDLVLAPYGEHWRQMQRFANRELLSARNIDTVRERYIERVVDGLVARMAESGSRGELVYPMQLTMQSNSNLMFRALFGSEEGESVEFLEHRDRLLSYITWLFASATATNMVDYIPWLRFLPRNGVKEATRQAEISSEVITALVEAARARPGVDFSSPTCLVEVMLAREETGEISGDMTKDLCADMIIAGTDTSAQTINWFLLLMANRPDIQARVHEELDRVIGRDAVPAVDDRARLPFVFACLAESMRYRTIGPLGLPHKASEDTEVGGYLIPAGTQVLGNIYSIHHNPDYWSSPHKFIPERFMPQADGSMSAAMTSPSYLPFGTGHRRCPGRRFAETTVWLHITRMMHRLRLETPDGRPLPEDEMFGLAISPKPYSLRVTQRW